MLFVTDGKLSLFLFCLTRVLKRTYLQLMAA